MADQNHDSSVKQRIAPSTTYNVEGAPGDYSYLFRGADLVLIDKSGQEQVFMFVGNIMSLDGNVNMQFGNGQALDSHSLFSRAEMEDMENQDDESVEWEVRFDSESPGERSEGNSADGTGLLPPAAQDEAVPAQAEAKADPTDAIMELQRRLISELSEKSGEDGNLSTFTPRVSSSPSPTADTGEALKPEDDGDDDKKDDEIVLSGKKLKFQLTADTDSGARDDDSITNIQNPDFEGVADPGATVYIRLDGELKDTVTADEDGKFFTSAINGLNHGEYEVQASFTNADGEMVLSDKIDLNIDVEAPGLTSLELLLEPGTGGMENDVHYTKDTTPTLQGSGGAPDSIITLRYSSDGGANYELLDSIEVKPDGSWTYTLPNALGAGSYSFEITVIDHAGNAGSGAFYLHDVVVKTDNPTSRLTLSTESDSFDHDAGGTDNDLVTNAETLELNITASSDTASVKVFMLVEGDWDEIGSAVKVGDSWVYKVDKSKISEDDTYHFVTQATDYAGNAEVIRYDLALTVEIDRTPPEIAPTIDLDVASDSADSEGLLGTDSDDYTNAASLTLNGTGGPGVPIDLYLSIDGGADVLISDGEIVTDAFGNWTYTYDSSDNGLSGAETLVFTAQILDAAGNVSETELIVNVDRSEPDIPTIGLANLLGSLDSDILQDVATVRNTDAVLEGVITEGSDDLVLTIYQVNPDGTKVAIANNMADNGALGDIVVTDNGDGTFAWSYDYGAIADGQTYTFVASVEDKAGNESDRDSKTFIINADTSISAPTIELDASTDTSGGPEGTVGDDYTGYVGGDENTPLKINVSGDDKSTIEVHLLDPAAAGAQDIVSGGVVIGSGVLVGTSMQDLNDDWPLITFDASAYAGTTTTLTFVAVSTDAAGNSTSTQYTMTFDDENPIAGSIDLDVSDDLGTSDTDNITSAKEILLSGTLEEGDTDVKVTIFDGGTEIGVASVVSDGSGGFMWTFVIGDESSVNAADYIATGEHSFTAVVEDNAGNTTTLDALSVTIDRDITAPTFVLTSGVGSSDTGQFTDDGITNAAELVFSGSSDVGDIITVHMVNEAGVDTVVETFDATTTNWNYTVLNGVIPADGEFSFYVTTADVAGNSSFTTPVAVTIDRTTNTPGAIDLVDGSDSFYVDGAFTAGTTNADNITSSNDIVLTGNVAADGVEPGSVVNLYIQGVVDPVGSVTVGAGDTSWSITVPQATIPDDTTYDFYITYVDLAGNESGPSADLEVVIDRTNPANPVIALDGAEGTDYFVHGGDIYTDEHAPTFTLSNLETGTTLNILVDGVSVSTPDVTSGSLVFDPTDFASDGTDDGVHTVSVIAVDAAGNASDEVTFSFNLDTSAEAISDVKLADDSNSGVVNDTITSDVTPEIVGSAEANSSVLVTIQDGVGVDVVSATVTADADGNWTYQVTDASLLTDGNTYTVVVAATDYAGNVATDSSYNFTIDTSIEPVNFAMIETEANDTGVAQDDQITSNQNPEFSWTAQENLTATISIFAEGGSLIESFEVDSPAGLQTWAVPGSHSLADGTYTITATFVDVAGNTVMTDVNGDPVLEEVEVTIDRDITAPTFVLTSGVGSSDTGRVTDDGITNADELVFSGSSDAGDTITVHMVNALGVDTVVETFDAATTNWNYIVLNGVVPTDGEYSFYVTTEDAAGNTSSTTPVDVTIDRTTNTPGAIDLADGSDSFYVDGAFTAGTTNADNITSSNDIVLTGNVAADGVEPGSVVNLYIQGVVDPVGSVTVGAGDTSWSITVPQATIPDDTTYDFYITYVDLAGNESGPSADLEVVIDRTNPANPVIALDGVEGADYFVHGGNVYTDEYAPTFTLSNLENGTTLNILVDGVSVATPGVTSGSLVFDPTDFASDGTDDGVHTVSVIAVDSAGNASDEVTFSFNLDTSAEAISDVQLAAGSNSGVANDTITSDVTPEIVGSAEANSSVLVTIQDGVGADVVSATVTADADGNWTYQVTDNSLLTDGNTYTVVVAATDYAGNVATDNSYSFSIDTSIDPVDFAMIETEANDTGIASDDQITSNRNPEFSWTAQEDLTATLSVFAEDGSLIKSFEVDSPAGLQTWAVPGGHSLADGTYTITATFVDVAGNTVMTDVNGDPVLAEVEVTIDTEAPALSLELADASDSGAKGDWLTNDESVAGGLELTGTAEAGSHLYIYVNDMVNPVINAETGAGGYIVVGADGTWTFDLSGLDVGSGINDGNNSIKVIAEDTAGNTTTLTETLEVDSEVVPVGGIFLHDDSDSGYKGDFVTNDKTPTLTGTTEVGSSVVLSMLIGGIDTVLGTAAIDGSGNWSFTVPVGTITLDGDYSFTATITDKAGNTDTTDRVITIDTDLAAPSVTMSDDTFGEFFGTDSDFVTSDTEPQFTVTTEVDTKLEIFLDGVLVHTVEREDNDSNGVFVFNQSELADGTYTYTFLSSDNAGNTSELTQTVVIDSQYDAADLTVSLDPDYDTGILNTDGLTNESRPVFTGTAEEGSRVQIFFSEKFDSEAAASASVPGAVANTTLMLAVGQTDWEYTPSNLVEDGFYKLTVVSEDEAGNQVTKTTIIELDTTPPEVPTFELTEDGGNSIISATQTIDNTPGFRGTAEAGSTITISVNEYDTDEVVRLFTVTADASGNWFYQVGADESLLDGSYDVVLTCTDDAGNAAVGNAGFMITGEDPVAPTIALAAADDSNVSTDGITNLNTGLSLTGIAQSHCDVKIYVTDASDTTRTNGVLVTTVEAAGNGTWSADLNGIFPDGEYYYYAQSEYSVGSVYTSELFTLSVDTDTINPTIELVEDTGVADEWVALGANDTDTDWETSNATITGVVDEGSTVRIQATNTATGVVTVVTISPENLTKTGDIWTYNHDLSALGDGEYSILVTSTDVAGNEGTSPIQTLVLDTTLDTPTLDLPDASDTELNVGGGGEILFPNGNPAGPALISHLPPGFTSTNTDGYTRDNNLPLSGYAEVGSMVQILIFKDGEAFPSPDIFTVTDAAGAWTYDTGVLEDGYYTFEVTSIDIAGNENQADSLNIYVDAEATRGAAIALNDAIPGNSTNDTTPVFTLYGDSDSTYLLYLDGGTDPVATGTFGVNSYVNYAPDDLVANEEHTYQLVTVDQAGNVQTSAIFTFEIDTISPVQQPDPVDVTGTSTITPAIGLDPMAFYTNDNEPTITVQVEAGTSAFLTGFGDNGWLTDTDGDGLITFNLVNNTSMLEGSHELSLMFRDAAQNHDENEDLTFNLVVDTNRPTTEIELKNTSDLGFSNSDGITSGDQLVLMGTILETGLGQQDGDFTSEIKDYSVVVTNTTDNTTTTIDSDSIVLNGDGTWEFTFGTEGVPLGSGDYTATLNAIDYSGNSHSSSVEFVVDNDDANVLQNPVMALQQIGNSGYYILQDSSYLPESVDHSNYKYELTFYGKDGEGNLISLSLPESPFGAGGSIEELVTPTLMSTYDHAGIKVIDYAGNETEDCFIDLDASDVTFVAEVETSTEVTSVNVSITGDTDGDGLVDVTINGTAVVDADDDWRLDFMDGPLDAGDYTLHIEGLDVADDPVSVGGESTYDFTVLAGEMQSDEQDFSIGEGDGGGAGGGGGGGGGGASDTVSIEANVHIDYVEGSVS